MSFANWIVENWDFLLLIVLAVAAVVLAIFKGNKSVIMNMLFSMVTEAEKAYGGGTGELKLAQVMAWIYPKLPGFMKAFVSEATLTKWIETALEAAKAKWEENAAIGAYIEEAEKEADNAASYQSAQSSSSDTPNT